MPQLMGAMGTQLSGTGNTLVCAIGVLCRCRVAPSLQEGMFGQRTEGKNDEKKDEGGGGEEKETEILETDHFKK